MDEENSCLFAVAAAQCHSRDTQARDQRERAGFGNGDSAYMWDF